MATKLLSLSSRNLNNLFRPVSIITRRTLIPYEAGVGNHYVYSEVVTEKCYYLCMYESYVPNLCQPFQVYKNFEWDVPRNFNFARDVIDKFSSESGSNLAFHHVGEDSR